VTSRALGPADTDHELLWTVLALVAGSAAWMALRGLVPPVLPPCVFKVVTGWPCVTCGATRAVEALFAADVSGAFRLNPLATLVTAGWSAYAVYGVGVLLRTWPRLKIELQPNEGTALRVAARRSDRADVGVPRTRP
jgi:hypothetical protein